MKVYGHYTPNAEVFSEAAMRAYESMPVYILKSTNGVYSLRVDVRGVSVELNKGTIGEVNRWFEYNEMSMKNA